MRLLITFQQFECGTGDGMHWKRIVHSLDQHGKHGCQPCEAPDMSQPTAHMCVTASRNPLVHIQGHCVEHNELDLTWIAACMP